MAHSDIITIGEHQYKLPPAPAKKDILFSNKKPEEQYWRRLTDIREVFYKTGPLTITDADYTEYDANTEQYATLSKEDTEYIKEIVHRELKRRKEGVWFMNNGQPTYLTGSHYFFLQWCFIHGYENPYDGSQYGEYREFQAHFFYFLDLCTKDKDCVGGFTAKPKKTGITQAYVGHLLNLSTMYKQKRYGLMSKSHEDVKGTDFMYFKFGLDNLPYILRPEVGTDNEDKIKFSAARSKNTGSMASKQRQLNNSKGFQTEVYAAPLKANAFDGPLMAEVGLDEFPKYKSPSPEDVWEKTKKTVMLGNLIKGKVFIFSYPPEEDDKSFIEARKIYFDSSITKRNAETGRTITGLYKYTISGLDSMEGSFDKYGKANKAQNLKTILANRAALKADARKLQAEVRQMPMNEEEAWRHGGAKGSPFATKRVNDKYNELMQAIDNGDLPYIEGKFMWMGERLKSEITFIKLTDEQIESGEVGEFRLYGFQNMVIPGTNPFNQVIVKNNRDDLNRLKPLPTTQFIGASDPTKYALKSDIAVGSKDGITVMNLPNVEANTYFGKRVTDRFVCTYLHRHENPKQYLEDLIMCIMFFGMYVLVEGNEPWVITALKDEGLQNFILVYDKDRKIVPYNEWEHSKLITSSAALIEDYCRAISDYLSERIDGTVSGLDVIEDERILKQAIEFDPMDTKKFDMLVCAGLNMLALRSFLTYMMSLANRESYYSPAAMQAAVNALG